MIFYVLKIKGILEHRRQKKSLLVKAALLRLTSFRLLLIHKPVYRFQWEKNMVGRSSKKWFLLSFWAYAILAY
jgi:hypothetical protein